MTQNRNQKMEKEYSPQRRRVRRVRSIFNKDFLLRVLSASAVSFPSCVHVEPQRTRRLYSKICATRENSFAWYMKGRKVHVMLL
jgi:hypothetical protein